MDRVYSVITGAQLVRPSKYLQVGCEQQGAPGCLATRSAGWKLSCERKNSQLKGRLCGAITVRGASPIDPLGPHRRSH